MTDINFVIKTDKKTKLPKMAPNAGPLMKPSSSDSAISLTPQSPPIPKEEDPDSLPSDPTNWPEDWHYEFVERSGLMFNSGVTWEEADKLAETMVRERFAQAHQKEQGELLLTKEGSS